MKIAPDQVSYLQLLTNCSKAKDAKKAEELFLEAKRTPGSYFVPQFFTILLGIGVSIQMYNSLIMCYTRRHDPDMALKILREMKDEGFKPDIVNYTTVINAYKNTKDLKKVIILFFFIK